MKLNPMNSPDAYKLGHRAMFPTGTELVYSNMTPRSNKLAKTLVSIKDDRIVVHSLQGTIKWFLQDVFNEGFFNLPKEQAVGRYKRRVENMLGPDAIEFDHVEALHDLGYLPLEIMALPEGSKIDPKVPMYTVHNTHPDFGWLVNYLETVLSNSTWKGATTATIAYKYRQILEAYAELTGTPKEIVGIQGHDFSCRGMSGPFDAQSSGVGHLLFFEGTDTVSAIDYAEEYYNADSDNEMVGVSVPATEHSVMCMGGKEEEIETFRRLIKQYPDGILAIVSDTWDFWKVITEYTVELKDEILNRKENALGLGKLVFRPDSGDPVKIVAGYKLGEYYGSFAEFNQLDVAKFREQGYNAVKVDGKYYECSVYQNGIWLNQELGEELTEAEVKGAVECLYDVFGGEKTETGHIMLNPRVGIIYGDSITLERCEAICQRLAEKGFASGNVVFGIGSYTYQYNTRDSHGFAVKATYGVVNGEGREIFKDPVTDSGTKKSAKGLLKVVKNAEGRLELKDQVTWDDVYADDNQMRTVFKNGQLTVDEDLATIRNRARNE